LNLGGTTSSPGRRKISCTSLAIYQLSLSDLIGQSREGAASGAPTFYDRKRKGVPCKTRLYRLRLLVYMPRSRAMIMRWICVVPPPMQNIFDSLQWRSMSDSGRKEYPPKVCIDAVVTA
jgi:hypothetical protein